MTDGHLLQSLAARVFSCTAAEAAADVTGCWSSRLGHQVSLGRFELYLPERCQHQHSDLGFGMP